MTLECLEASKVRLKTHGQVHHKRCACIGIFTKGHQLPVRLWQHERHSHTAHRIYPMFVRMKLTFWDTLFHSEYLESNCLYKDCCVWFTLLRIWPWSISAMVVIKITEPLDVIIISVIGLPVRLNILQHKRRLTERKTLVLITKRLPDFYGDTQIQLFLLAECISLIHSGKCHVVI